MLQKHFRPYVILFVAAVIYTSVLFAHCYLLYREQSSVADLWIQTFLRLGVGIAPLILTVLFVHSRTAVLHSIAFVLWLFFIPYCLYNFFQLRHICELFPVEAGERFTNSMHVHALWKILPCTVYAISQGILFMYCLRHLSLTCFTGIRRYLFCVMICLYAAVGTNIGLVSRLDTYHLISETTAVIHLFSKEVFSFNSIWIFLFSFSGYLAFDGAYKTVASPN